MSRVADEEGSLKGPESRNPVVDSINEEVGEDV